MLMAEINLFLILCKFTPNEGMNEREKEREMGRENRGEG